MMRSQSDSGTVVNNVKSYMKSMTLKENVQGQNCM